MSVSKCAKILLVCTKWIQLKIFAAIKDVYLRLNLAISKVRGQCYDGAGAKSGVIKKMCDAEP